MKLLKKKISELQLAEYNPRQITEEALKGLTASIRKFGYVEPIVWNERTSRVIGGHQRIKALEKLDKKTAEVVCVDLSEADERKLNVALNNENLQGDWDYPKLEIMLEEFKCDYDEFKELRFDELELPETQPKDEKIEMEDIEYADTKTKEKITVTFLQDDKPHVVNELNRLCNEFPGFSYYEQNL